VPLTEKFTKVVPSRIWGFILRTNEPIFPRVTFPVLEMVTTGKSGGPITEGELAWVPPCACVIALPSTNTKARVRRILLMIFVLMLIYSICLFVCLLVTTLYVVQSSHTELAKLYSQKVIYCLANPAALFDIGHAPKDQLNRRIHLPCYAASEIHPVMALHVLQ